MVLPISNTICLDPRYSTTRCVTTISPINKSSIQYQFGEIQKTATNTDRLEGGLRLNGYYKSTLIANIRGELPGKLYPLISIITVVRNGAKYLEKCIKSVIDQNYLNVEYIIIDGGSDDGTLEIIKQYEACIDYWISEKDDGIYYAINKGLVLISGNLIGVLNCDDWYEIDILEYVSEVLINSQCDYVYGNVYRADIEGNKYGITHPMNLVEVQNKVPQQMPVPHPALFVKSEVYNKLGLYNTKYTLSADFDFLMVLIKNNLKGVYVGREIATFRDGGLSDGTQGIRETRDISIKHGRLKILAYFDYIRYLLQFRFSSVLPASVLKIIRKLRRSRHKVL